MMVALPSTQPVLAAVARAAVPGPASQASVRAPALPMLLLLQLSVARATGPGSAAQASVRALALVLSAARTVELPPSVLVAVLLLMVPGL
jgi:hypothetical protein